MAHLVIAAPIRPGANSGNDVTAARWSTLLTDLGHDVDVLAVDETAGTIDDEATKLLGSADVLIALHARRSALVARWWAQHRPDRPLVIGLAGTDLYRDMPDDTEAMWSVDQADALIVLQSAAMDRLAGFDPAWAAKCHVIHQSVQRNVPRRTPVHDEFRVVVLAHLRAVKDPLLCARAARLLPPSSRLVVHHAGRAHDEKWHAAATEEAAINHRYRWHGELDGDAALRLLATADLLACTSLSEGGANVVTEAIAIGVPVIGTLIDGNTGLLGDDYPGLIPVGDEHALAALLTQLETSSAALADLQQRIDALEDISASDTERTSLQRLVESLTPTP